VVRLSSSDFEIKIRLEEKISLQLKQENYLQRALAEIYKQKSRHSPAWLINTKRQDPYKSLTRWKCVARIEFNELKQKIQ